MIIAHDNDESGLKFVKEVVPRLGRVMCAVIADGHFAKHSEKAKTYNRARLNIKRKDKQERLRIDLGANDDNKWQKQTELVNWLIQFSMKYNVCTILVCHPRKMQDLTENVGLYELSGTANLINLAHRAISLRRIGKKEKAGIPNAKGDGWVKPPCPYDVVVSVQKDRLRGRANLECGLYYDVPSRRFFTKPEEFEHNYAWDTTEYIDHVPYPVVDAEEEIFGK